MPYDEEDESRILFEMQCAMEDSARAEAEAASYEQAEAEAHSAEIPAILAAHPGYTLPSSHDF